MKFRVNSAAIIIIIIISLILVIRKTNSIDNRDGIRCNKRTERKMDSGVANVLVVGQKRQRFPENAQQLRAFCNECKKLIDFIDNYAINCFPNFAKQAARLFVLAVNKQIKIICKSGKLSAKATELLNAAPCGNAGLERFHTCNVNLIDAFIAIPNADLKLRIPMSCCHYHKLRECLVSESEEVKVCTKATVDYVDKFVGSILDGLLQFLCFQYDESNGNCAQLIRDTPKRNASIPRPKSILPALAAIAASIGDTPDTNIGSF